MDTKLNYREYLDEDFELINEFLQHSYALNGPLYCWNIDRWNFTRSVSRCMHGVTLDELESQVLVVEENGNIVAVVNSEGEKEGEAFFQLVRDHYSVEIIRHMFDFVEDKLSVEKGDKRHVYLRLNIEHKEFVDEAIRRGFVKEDNTEPTSELVLMDDQSFDSSLPEGFRFVNGNTLSGAQRACVHAKAFGYFDEQVYLIRAGAGFKTMEIQPFYNPYLDINVVNEEGEPVAFANFWYDPLNHLSIIEPVGTHEDFRRKGLAKAAIYEGIKRSKELGAQKIYVGSDQDFYKAIGFKVIGHTNIFSQKKINESKRTVPNDALMI